jgi:hypothetical protein
MGRVSAGQDRPRRSGRRPSDHLPQELPPQRALRAMEKAVGRSRTANSLSVHGGARSAAYLRERRLRRVTWWLLGLTASLTVVLVAATLSGSTKSPAGGGESRSGHPSSKATGHERLPTGSNAPPASSATSTPTSVPTTAVPGSKPTLLSLIPSSGSAGQTITLSGTNLFSPDGRVSAAFDGQVAPTSCTSQTECTATVPPLAGPSANVAVTVTTAGGTSNTIYFMYS